MVWPMVIAAAATAAASYMSAKKQAAAAEKASENSGAPWAGLQPYLTGTFIPEWMNTEVTPSNDWASYIQSLNQGNAGTYNQAPPPMFGSYGLQPGQGYSPYAGPAGSTPEQEVVEPDVVPSPPPSGPVFRPGEGYGDENGSLPLYYPPDSFGLSLTPRSGF